MTIRPVDSNCPARGRRSVGAVGDQQVTPARVSQSEVADLEEVLPISNSSCKPSNVLFPLLPSVPVRPRPGMDGGVAPEDLRSIPRAVGDGQVVVVHRCQAKAANLHKVLPEGNAVREADGPVPRTEVRSGSWVQSPVGPEDLGRPAITVGDAEVVSINGRQAPITQLDEAIAPGSKAPIAGAEGDITNLGARPLMWRTIDKCFAKIVFVVEEPFESTIAAQLFNDPVRVGAVGVENHQTIAIVSDAELADLEIPAVPKP